MCVCVSLVSVERQNISDFAFSSQSSKTFQISDHLGQCSLITGSDFVNGSVLVIEPFQIPSGKCKNTHEEILLKYT